VNRASHPTRYVFMLGLLLLATYGRPALGVTIDVDTTITATNWDPDDLIEIVDGADGPTTVIMEPDTVAFGVHVSENSLFEMKGGMILSHYNDVTGDGVFILRGGVINCTLPYCLDSDIDGQLRLADRGAIHILGGEISGLIELNDESTAHLYGKDLKLSFPGSSEIWVTGTFADGTQGFFTLEGNLDQVFVHNVPEPRTLAGFAGFAMMLYLLHQRRRRKEQYLRY
jgi:hypothetical protein